MLPQILPAEAFGFLLVFTRIGAMMMVMPAFGEVGVPRRVRLILALTVSFLVYLAIRENLPPIPSSAFGLAGMLILEIVIGLLIGGAARLIAAALHVTGTIIGFQSGLAAAQQFDPTQGSQSALMANFLAVVGITMIFATDLHHLLIGAARGSYVFFPVGSTPMFGDFATMTAEIVASSFLLGVKMAAPFLAYGIIYNIGLGIVSRLMPQLPVFFVGIPLNVFLGFAILMMVISSMMLFYTSYFESRISLFLP